MKKLSQILLLTLVVVTLVSAFVFSANAIDISSAAQLAKLMAGTDTTNYPLDGDYVLRNNINMSGQTQSPIGDNDTPFRGTFNGGGYAISNINITAGQYTGLFGVTANATIKNLTVSGTVKSTIATDESARTGGLVGMSRGDLTLTGVTTKIDVTTKGNNVGGLIGLVDFNDTSTTNLLTITDCANEGTISGGKYVGGMVGALGGSDAYSQAGTLKITNTHNRGTVKSTGNCAAGFVGYFNFMGTSNRGDLYIAHCTNTATITGGDGFVGGIVGGYLASPNTYASDLTLEVVQNRGKVSGKSAVGTIMGAFRMPKSNSETLRDCLNCGLSTNLPMIDSVSATTKTSKLTLAGFYNKAG